RTLVTARAASGCGWPGSRRTSTRWSSVRRWVKRSAVSASSSTLSSRWTHTWHGRDSRGFRHAREDHLREGGMIRTGRIAASLVLVMGVIVACSVAPPTEAGKDELVREAAAALMALGREVPGVEAFARGSHGYAIFPSVSKGGLGLGAAYGRGV